MKNLLKSLAAFQQEVKVIHKATQEMYLRDKKVINPHPTVEKMFDEKKESAKK